MRAEGGARGRELGLLKDADGRKEGGRFGICCVDHREEMLQAQVELVEGIFGWTTERK